MVYFLRLKRYSIPLVLLLVVLSAFFPWFLVAGFQTPLKIHLSKETTFFTEPLRKDGSIDYWAAINQYNKPENLIPKKNGAVFLVKAIGLQENQNKIHTRNLWKAIGLSEDASGILAIPTRQDPKLVDADTFRLLQIKNLSEDEKGKRDKHLSATLICKYFKPWKKEDYPDRWNWLQINNASLDLVVQATKQPFFYIPVVKSEDDSKTEKLVSAYLFVAENSYYLSKILVARALNHLGEGRDELALKDIMALHHLARQIGNSGSLMHGMVGLAIEKEAFDTNKAIIKQRSIAPEILRMHSKELQTLGSIIDIKAAINIFNRCLILEAIQELSNPSNKNAEPGKNNFAFLNNYPSNKIDWNQILVSINQHYDKLILFNLVPYSDWKEYKQTTISELEVYSKNIEELNTFAGRLRLWGMGRKQKANYFANIFKALLTPSISGTVEGKLRASMRNEMLVVFISLELYKHDHGKYPEKLKILVPKYLEKVPLDRFTDNKNIKYRSDGESFTLYSIGVNGKDDGGILSEKFAGGNDDIVIKSP